MRFPITSASGLPVPHSAPPKEHPEETRHPPHATRHSFWFDLVGFGLIRSDFQDGS
jgi:hypothetical protein